MKKTGSIIAATLGFVLLWGNPAFSKKPLSSYNLLQGVSVERSDHELLIQVKFRKPPSNFLGPQFFKKSVQMDFPATYANPSKRYFETGDSQIRQVYVSQFDAKRLRLRLILAPGTENLKNRTVIEQVGNILRIRIHRKAEGEMGDPQNTPDSLETLLERADRIQNGSSVQTKTTSGFLESSEASKTAPVPKEKSAPGPAASSKKYEKRSIPLSETLGQALKDETPRKKTSSQALPLKPKKAGLLDWDNDSAGGKPDLFSASLKMIYTLVLVLGLMFIVFHFFKKFGLKNSVFGGEGRPINVLSTGFLAPRKSIALVEIAGDVLVLGIANDQISLLGNVQDPEKIEQIKGSLKKKARRNIKFDATPEPEKNPPQEELLPEVDAYKKRLVQSGTTNPFGEYVKKFTNSPKNEQDSGKPAASRVRKKFQEVPIFE